MQNSAKSIVGYLFELRCNPTNITVARDTTLDGFSGQFFRILKIIYFYFLLVAICDLVHDVEAILHLP